MDEAALSGALAEAVTTQRWFRSKASQIKQVNLFDSCAIGGYHFHLFEIETVRKELYSIPLADGRKEGAFQVCADGVWRHDALTEDGFLAAVTELIRTSTEVRGRKGVFSASADGDIPATVQHAKPVGAEQSNSSFILNGMIYKHYRKLEEGENPDYEVPRYLVSKGFTETPEPLGKLEYIKEGRYLAASLFRYIKNSGDCWSFFTQRLNRFFSEGGNDCMDYVRSIAEMTAEMHSLLSQGKVEFAPTAIEETDIMEWKRDFLQLLQEVQMNAAAPTQNTSTRERIGKVLRTLESTADAAEGMMGAYKIRIHGDYHLGQILNGEDKLYVIDFEGEPMRSLQYRRRTHTALRDVAGMLRSLNYAAIASGGGEKGEEWSMEAEHIFMETYLSCLRGAVPLLPEAKAIQRTLAFFLAEKAMYELNYEMNNRPAWISIPLQGLERYASTNIW
ncbi:MAG: phosphotransferase [Methanomassiliicoccales archaeon]